MLDINNPIIDKFKQAITSTHVNGGIIIKCFKINNKNLLSPYLSEEHERYFNKFFTSKDIKQAIPELKIEDELVCKTDFERISPFLLDGDFGDTIYHGGAYESFPGTPKEAKKLGEELCQFIFGDRILDILPYRSYNPWSTWFYDVAWDCTWFLIDKELKRIWVICVTDTD
ncbi:hypothetical protein WAK64_08405 [Bacillus spongiae]|uniref:SMI1/KNR4 family protein n=1 Tax=Bacillus spongiae TaxID=2683610 RepID=A0ABU8HD38_9BACI